MSEENKDIENAAEEFAKSQEAKIEKVTPLPETSQPTSLGKAQSFLEEAKPIVADIGWKAVPLQNLPSQGLFYPEGTQIAIRAASVGEIRHWSTIDENDVLAMDDMINYIIEKCCQVKIPGHVSNWADIKEIDRLYLIFAIREYTFKDGENKIYVNAGEGERIEVRKEMLNYFNIDDRLKRYYDSNKKCFTFKLKNGEEFNMYMPSIGVTAFIKNYVRGKQQLQQKIDSSYVKYASFLHPDYRTLTNQIYEKSVQDSAMWSLQKISVLSGITDIFVENIEPKVTYKTPGGGELTAPLNFQGGIKSIFIISDIFDELV